MRINRHYFKCFLLALVVASTNAYSGTLLMKIPGITGEYQGEKFTGWIEIYSFSGGISEGGCDSFDAPKFLDSTSPAILMAAAMATSFPTIEIVDLAFDNEQKPIKLSSFLLNNAVISSVSLSASEDSLTNEELTIVPSSLTLNVYTSTGDLNGTTTVQCGKVKIK
jgi:type VI protein secretion system component Hcp